MRFIKRSVVRLGQNICKGEKMTELESKKEQKELELDDLLISSSDDTDEVLKESGSKKIVLLSAIGVLLFAVVVLIVYMFQGDSKKQEEHLESQMPLERVEQQTTNSQTTNSQTNDFGQEPIQGSGSSDDQFQRIIDQIKAEQAKQNGQNLPNVPESKPAPEVVDSAIPTTPIKPQTSKPQTPKVESPKQNPADTFKDIKASDPKLQGSEATKGFYVQVGSFSKFSPNKQLMGLIESSKLSYRMQKSGDNNRLLIGPFASKKIAQDKLSEIREKINKDAFVKEIK